MSNAADVAAHFERIVKQSDKKIVLIFDEIENITFGLSPAKHWNEDFLHFWSTIRAVHQSTNGKLCFGVAGVNPYMFDVPMVSGRDNPILLGVSPKYLAPLDEHSTKEMVETISRFMGLTFAGDIYPWLYEQYGGLPLLTRKACSAVCNKAKKNRVVIQ